MAEIVEANLRKPGFGKLRLKVPKKVPGRYGSPNISGKYKPRLF